MDVICFLSAVALISTLLQATHVRAGLNTTFINHAENTTQGRRFNDVIGEEYFFNTIHDIAELTWKIFEQDSEEDQMDATLGLVIVNNTKVQSFVYLYELTIGTGYIDNYEDDNILKEEVTKCFFQLTVESLQWGEATLPNALFLGIVEFVMIEGDNGSENVKMGDGEKWDESPEVTGCFLEYCNNEMPGFVAGLNNKMKDSYYTNFTFRDLFGKSLDDAWAAYKDQYSGN